MPEDVETTGFEISVGVFIPHKGTPDTAFFSQLGNAPAQAAHWGLSRLRESVEDPVDLVNLRDAERQFEAGDVEGTLQVLEAALGGKFYFPEVWDASKEQGEG